MEFRGVARATTCTLGVLLTAMLIGGANAGGDANHDVELQSLLTCIVGCATELTGCSTMCVNLPLGEASGCAIGCIDGNTKCLVNCAMPAPPPPAAA
ncbi:hypothetical protein BRADI_5g23992v3 [Brachypodium distachyon]|uniref:Uncharacterized protein n=1 Tax=Brachypodium distachyon TaxID=15368 RepID=I1J2L1_BRADI|nr:hypothetical protein BRADI_5g23992v3 [Brachypodium distachyon]